MPGSLYYLKSPSPLNFSFFSTSQHRTECSSSMAVAHEDCWSNYRVSALCKERILKKKQRQLRIGSSALYMDNAILQVNSSSLDVSRMKFASMKRNQLVKQTTTKKKVPLQNTESPKHGTYTSGLPFSLLWILIQVCHSILFNFPLSR